MESLWILVPLSLLIAAGIGAVFWWAVSDGQMDDLDSPGQRILIDNDRPPAPDGATTAAATQLEADSARLAVKAPSPQHRLPVI